MQRCFYFLLVLLSIGLNTAIAGNKPVKAHPKSKPLVVVYDSSKVDVRHFSEAALAKYRSQPDFQYQETTVSTNIWTRFWRWFWNWLRELLKVRTGKGAPSTGIIKVILIILEYVAILLAIAGIVYLILKMVGVDLPFLFRRKSRAVPVPYTESLENIHEINFDNAIEEAINKHNYRLAVRLLYLKCLKQLSDASLIKWQPEKTNSSYLNELKDVDQKAIFNSLTRRFEYVWYGEFPLDGQTFGRINLQFQEFKSKIA
jgi:hypothetical protein